MQKESSQESKDYQEFKKIYDYKKSQAWKVLGERYHHKLITLELLDIVSKIPPKIQESPSRLIKRHKGYLVKWFDDNLLTIQPLLPEIELTPKEILIEKWKNNQNNTMAQNTSIFNIFDCPSNETKNPSDLFFEDDFNFLSTDLIL